MFISLGLEYTTLKEDLKQVLKKKTKCIIMNGGNTFHISQLIHHRGWFDFIKDLVENHNIPYIGYSAGAIMATPTVFTAQWADIIPRNFEYDEESWSGFDFVDFFIKPHSDYYLPKYTTSFKNFSIMNGKDFYCIYEIGAIVIDEDESVRWYTKLIGEDEDLKSCSE